MGGALKTLVAIGSGVGGGGGADTDGVEDGAGTKFGFENTDVANAIIKVELLMFELRLLRIALECASYRNRCHRHR